MAIEKVLLVCGGRRTGTTLMSAVLSSDESTPPLPGEAQLLPKWIESYKWAAEHFEVRALPFFEDLRSLRRHHRRILRGFVAHCARTFPDATAMVLKSPELSFVLTEACQLLPDAKIVVTVRDPRDQVASEWQVVERRAGSERDRRVIRERDFRTIAGWYNWYNEPILAALAKFTDRIHLQPFEELVERPAVAVERLEEFTGLDLRRFDPTGDWPRVADTYWAYGTGPSDSEHYGGPIEPGRVGAYPEVLSTDEADLVLEVCGDVAGRLGYDFS